MKKLLTLLLLVSVVLISGMGCGKKAQVPAAPKPIAAPNSSQQIPPISPANPQAAPLAKPGTPGQAPAISPDSAKLSAWSDGMRVKLQKRGEGNVNNIALPQPAGSKVVIMTGKFSKEGLKNLGAFVAADYKKNFPGRQITIEINDNGKPALTLKIK